jgi:hypothetical protein
MPVSTGTTVSTHGVHPSLICSESEGGQEGEGEGDTYEEEQESNGQD